MPPPSRAGLHVSKSGAPQLGLRALFPPFSPFSTHAGGRGLRLGLGVSPGAPRQPAGWEGSGHGSCLMGRAWAAPVLPGEKFACPPRAAGGCHRPCHLQGWGNRGDLCEGRGTVPAPWKGSGAAVGAGIPQAAPCCEAGRAGGGIWSLLTAAVPGGPQISVLNGHCHSRLGLPLRRCCWETLPGSGRSSEPVCLLQP